MVGNRKRLLKHLPKGIKLENKRVCQVGPILDRLPSLASRLGPGKVANAARDSIFYASPGVSNLKKTLTSRGNFVFDLGIGISQS